MNKIPFWRTIGSAYSFTFGNLATIIGLIWLPMTVLCVAGYLAIARYFDGILAAIAAGNRFAAYAGVEDYYLFRFAALLLEAVMAVAVMRQALVPRTKPVFASFWLGGTELRMFAAYVAVTFVMLAIDVLAFVALVVAIVIIGVVARLAGAGHGSFATIAAGWTLIAFVFAFLAGIVFVWVRLNFLLVPVTVAENRIDLIRAWELTRGNFWRVLFITLLTSIPVWILYLTLQLAFVGFAFAGEASTSWPFGIDLASAAENTALRTRRILELLPYLYGAWFLIRPLTLGLTTGATAMAYRALVPEPAAVSTEPAELRAATS